jgi:hypothetical protein
VYHRVSIFLIMGDENTPKVTTPMLSSDDTSSRRRKKCEVRWAGWLVVFGGFLVHLTLGNMYTVGERLTLPSFYTYCQ